MECEESGNFIEAELARQRVGQLTKIKMKRDYKDAKYCQEREKDELALSQREEIFNFTSKLDMEQAELMKKFDDMKKELRNKQNAELQEFCQNLENNYPTEGKPSNDLIEAKKHLEYFAKVQE